ncbi:ATP-binding cassette domain-containing protein [Mogibacterium sp.]
MKPNTRPGQISKSIILSVSEVLKYSKIFIILTFIVMIISGIMPIISIKIIQKLMNYLQEGHVSFRSIVVLLVAYCIVNLVLGGILSIYNYYSSLVEQEFNKLLNIKMLKKTDEFELKDYENPDTYNLITRAQSQSGTAIISVIRRTGSIVREFVSILGAASILISFRWWIIIPCVGVPVVKAFVSYKIDKKRFIIHFNRTIEERKAWYIKYLLMMGRGIKDIKFLNLSRYFVNKYDDFQTKFNEQDRYIYRSNLLISILFDVVSWVLNGCILLFIIVKTFLRELMIGDFSAYVDCVSNIFDSTENIFDGVEELASEALYVSMLFDYLNYDLDKSTLQSQRDINLKDINSIECIELENVSYKYGDIVVLSNLNAKIKKGEHVRIQGCNGSGKTTLIKILSGLYTDYEGTIKINGVDLKFINLDTYRKCISCVFQDYAKFESSFLDNVAYSNIYSTIDYERILEALAKVKLRDKVQNIGIQTLIGSWFGETELSGGEWQRLAIARALYRSADVYIFDEIDASLDEEARKSIRNYAIDSVKEKIIIEVSHRESAYDQITNEIYLKYV